MLGLVSFTERTCRPLEGYDCCGHRVVCCLEDDPPHRHRTVAVARRQNFHVDASGRTIHTSSILDWFGEDFGRSQAKRLASLRPYLPKVAQKMVTSSSVRVVYLKYDWGLNDQARQRKRTARR
jgi:hypothetical protein